MPSLYVMPAALCSTLFAVAAAEPAPQPISVQTALLLIFGTGLLLAVKAIADLRRRVDRLAAEIHPKAPGKQPESTASLPPEIVVVISAAVFEVVSVDHRIITICTAGQDNLSWSQEGRRQVFAGRKVR